MHDSVKSRDGHIAQSQKTLAAAIVRWGSAITQLLLRASSPHQGYSITRRELLLPKISDRSACTLLQSSPIDDLLLGQNLGDCIKANKSALKESKELFGGKSTRQQGNSSGLHPEDVSGRLFVRQPECFASPSGNHPTLADATALA